MAIRVSMAEVSGARVRGRSRLGWIDSVAGMSVEAARQCAEDMKEWRALVQMQEIECDFDHIKLLGSIVIWIDFTRSNDLPPSKCVGGGPLHDAVARNCTKPSITEDKAQIPRK